MKLWLRPFACWFFRGSGRTHWPQRAGDETETLTVVGIFIMLRDLEQATDWLSYKLIWTCAFRCQRNKTKKSNTFSFNKWQRRGSATFFIWRHSLQFFNEKQPATIRCSGARRASIESHQCVWRIDINTKPCNKARTHTASWCCYCNSHHIRQRLENWWKVDAAYACDAQ